MSGGWTLLHHRESVGEWADLAACKGLTSLMFPDNGAGTQRAKAVCQRCPVRIPCAQHAINNDESLGIWGALSGRERARIRDRRAKRKTA